jgi:hypothetical protein
MNEADLIRQNRTRLKERYHLLYDEILDIVFRHDPIGINFETNADEYEPEVGTILPRLKEAASPNDLRSNNIVRIQSSTIEHNLCNLPSDKLSTWTSNSLTCLATPTRHPRLREFQQ